MWRLSTLTCAIALLVLVTACAGEPESGAAPKSGRASEGPEQPGAALARERAKTAALALGRDLKQRLLRELQAGGASEAVKVCSEVAPDLAKALSTDGLTVRRTTLKARNPANVPDAFEEAALLKLEALHREGRLPADFAEVEVTADGRQLRYMRPLVVGELCLKCHGAAASLAADVAASIAERYPDDRATGYASGDFRGVISVIAPLD